MPRDFLISRDQKEASLRQHRSAVAASLAAAASIVGAFAAPRRASAVAVDDATWSTATASWSSAANWSHSNGAAAGLVPNNGNGGFQFNAIIPNGVPIQDVANLTINNLIFNNGTINGSNSISLATGGTWTGGGYNVSAA